MECWMREQTRCTWNDAYAGIAANERHTQKLEYGKFFAKHMQSGWRMNGETKTKNWIFGGVCRRRRRRVCGICGRAYSGSQNMCNCLRLDFCLCFFASSKSSNRLSTHKCWTRSLRAHVPSSPQKYLYGLKISMRCETVRDVLCFSLSSLFVCDATCRKINRSADCRHQYYWSVWMFHVHKATTHSRVEQHKFACRMSM